MNKKIFALAIIIAFLALPVFMSCKGGGGAAITQEKCPVMGDPITSRNVYVDYQGKRIYFCCAGCPDEFKKDPEKYMKKLDPAKLEDAPGAK